MREQIIAAEPSRDPEVWPVHVKLDWSTRDGYHVKCDHCTTVLIIDQPGRIVRTGDALARGAAFAEKHRHCRPVLG